jgi:hypothetical protein
LDSFIGRAFRLWQGDYKSETNSVWNDDEAILC